MDNNGNSSLFFNINELIQLLRKNNISAIINYHNISCKKDKEYYFSLDYGNDYLRLIMDDNDVSSLYEIANILKNKLDIPTVQYSLICKDREDILHPTLEWRFDNQTQYITHLVNSSVIGENYFCTHIKLFNGKEIEDYRKEENFQKKKK